MCPRYLNVPVPNTDLYPCMSSPFGKYCAALPELWEFQNYMQYLTHLEGRKKGGDNFDVPHGGSGRLTKTCAGQALSRNRS